MAHRHKVLQLSRCQREQVFRFPGRIRLVSLDRQRSAPFDNAKKSLYPASARCRALAATELLEEGHSFDARIVSGIEDAPPADEGDIKTR